MAGKREPLKTNRGATGTAGKKKATPTDKDPRRLLRKWKRGEDLTPAENLELLKRVGWQELHRIDQERVRADRVRRQSRWLRHLSTEATSRVKRLGLPRDVWRQLTVPDLLPSHREEEPEPLDRITFLLRDPSPSFDWCKEHQGTDELDQALWSAALLLAVNEAKACRDPERRFILGRFVEACRVNLMFEEVRKRANASFAGMRRAARRKQETRERNEALRAEYGQRIQNGEASAAIIASMAKHYGFTKEWLRRIIRPRQQKNHVRHSLGYSAGSRY